MTSEDTIGLLSMDKPRSLPARFHDAFIEADIPMIFTTNKKPKKIFPREESSKQRAAIKRRYVSVEVTSSLARLGRPMTPAEKRVRREAGRNGPLVRVTRGQKCVPQGKCVDFRSNVLTSGQGLDFRSCAYDSVR